MRIKYYETAWRDISNSPGWFGKLCLLALLNFIPIFGQLVTFGYFYGWAREIAWGTHAPMPSKLICNEDGKFWRRGWFAMVISFVYALIPAIVSGIGQAVQRSGFAISPSGTSVLVNPAIVGVGELVYLIGLVAAIFISMLAWVATMRASIYDRLSPGFQFGKVWKMFRRDIGGMFRILGMQILVGIIVSIVVSIVVSILIFIAMSAGIAGLVAAGFNPDSIQHMTEAQAARFAVQFVASSGIVGFLCVIASIFVILVSAMFVNALVYRAVGYWTSQFDVPHWRGKDDPMPFEVEGSEQAAYAPIVPPMEYADTQQVANQANAAAPLESITSAAPGAPMGAAPTVANPTASNPAANAVDAPGDTAFGAGSPEEGGVR